MSKLLVPLNANAVSLALMHCNVLRYSFGFILTWVIFYLVSGYVRSNHAALGGCVDVNECDSNLRFLHFCGNDASCINTDGSYFCQCNTGFHSGQFSNDFIMKSNLLNFLRN